MQVRHIVKFRFIHVKLNLQKGFLQVFALSHAFGNSPYSEWVILYPTLIKANSQV